MTKREAAPWKRNGLEGGPPFQIRKSTRVAQAKRQKMKRVKVKRPIIAFCNEPKKKKFRMPRDGIEPSTFAL